MAPADFDLWEWASAFYRLPGLAEVLIELQDRRGQSIPYLLWRLWRLDRDASGEVLARAAALARDWEASIIGPLRAARRALPRMGDLGEAENVGTLRVLLGDVERDAERQLLERLEPLPWLEARRPVGNPLTRLRDAVKVFGGPLDETRLRALVAARATALDMTPGSGSFPPREGARTGCREA